MNRGLKKAQTWATQMGVKFSAQKCVAILFYSCKKEPKKYPIKIGGHVIKYEKETKYLGLTFDTIVDKPCKQQDKRG